MNKKTLFPLAKPGNYSLNDDSISKELSFGEDNPLATADSLKLQQLYRSISKDGRMVLKTHSFSETVFDGSVVLDGRGAVVFSDNVLIFDEGKDYLDSTVNTNRKLIIRLGQSKETNGNLCVAKFGDDTFKLPNIVLFRGHLEKETDDDDEDIEYADECDLTVTLVYIAKYGLLEVSYNSELPSSLAVDTLYSLLLSILFSNTKEKRIEPNE